MRPLRLRTKLTLSYITITLALFAVFGTSIYRSQASSLRTALESELSARADGLIAITEWDEGFEFEPEAHSRLAALGADAPFGFEMWSAGQLLLAAGMKLPTRGTPEDHAFVVHEAQGILLGQRSFDAGGPHPLSLRIGASLAPLDAQLARTSRQLLMHLAWVCVVVILLGLVLSKRLLRPVRDLATAAAAVEPGHSAAMPLRGSGDELDQLAATLESSFQRLEHARDRQSRFTANAAHELRNPVAAILSNAQVAARRERSPDEYKSFFTRTWQESRRMQGIVDALLLLARVEQGRGLEALTTCRLDELIQQRARALDPSGEQLVLELEECIELRGHAALLEILGDNLLRNALEHRAGTAPARVTLRADPEWILLEVRNAQSGLDADAASRIFERFYRGPNEGSGPGAGLGLALVREIAALHGGECESELVDEELRVRVRLARSPSAPAERKPAERRPAP